MMTRRKFVIAAAATLVVPGPGRAGTRPTALPTTSMEAGGVAATLGLPRPIHFLVRVGYVDRCYPEPVSPRRALASFVNA